MMRVLRFALLIEVLIVIVFLWLSEAVIAAFGRRSKSFVGGAMGAGAIMRWYARMVLKFTGWLKKLIARYLKSQHPATFRRVRNLLLPKKLK